MNAVLFLSLAIILGAALWPGTYSRSQHHRLRDKQPPAYETKAFHHEALQKAAVKLQALDVRPTPEASQKAAVKLWDGNSETYLMQGNVIAEFEERWIARAPNSFEERGRRPAT
jgi:hypothetical protein